MVKILQQNTAPTYIPKFNFKIFKILSTNQVSTHCDGQLVIVFMQINIHPMVWFLTILGTNYFTEIKAFACDIAENRVLEHFWKFVD